MIEYTVTFTTTLIIIGTITVQAKDDNQAEREAYDIADNLKDNPPIIWQPRIETQYKIEWEEDSYDIDVTEVV